MKRYLIKEGIRERTRKLSPSDFERSHSNFMDQVYERRNLCTHINSEKFIIRLTTLVAI